MGNTASGTLPRRLGHLPGSARPRAQHQHQQQQQQQGPPSPQPALARRSSSGSLCSTPASPTQGGTSPPLPPQQHQQQQQEQRQQAEQEQRQRAEQEQEQEQEQQGDAPGRLDPLDIWSLALHAHRAHGARLAVVDCSAPAPAPTPAAPAPAFSARTFSYTQLAARAGQLALMIGAQRGGHARAPPRVALLARNCSEVGVVCACVCVMCVCVCVYVWGVCLCVHARVCCVCVCGCVVCVYVCGGLGAGVGVWVWAGTSACAVQPGSLVAGSSVAPCLPVPVHA